MASPKLFMSILIFVGGLGAALGISEAILAVVRPYGSASLVSGDQYSLYRFDPLLGWRQIPDISVTFQRAEFSHSVETNKWGMRDHPRTKQPLASVWRLAVLGDSFSWGLGVAAEDRYTEQLQKSVGERVEVLNFGVSGYGPVHYLLLLEEVLSFKPSAVLIQFCLSNDYADNVQGKRYGYNKPYATLDNNGQLAIITDGVEPTALYHTVYPFASVLLAKLVPYSRVADLLHFALRQPLARDLSANQRGLVGLGMDQGAIYRPQSDDDRAAALLASRINRALFSRIKQKLGSHGITLVVAAAPTKCEVGECLGISGAPLRQAREMLAQDMAALGIPLVDPSDSFTLRDFWVSDGHWKPEGHRKFADVLIDAPLLRDQSTIRGARYFPPAP